MPQPCATRGYCQLMSIVLLSSESRRCHRSRQRPGRTSRKNRPQVDGQRWVGTHPVLPEERLNFFTKFSRKGSVEAVKESLPQPSTRTPAVVPLSWTRSWSVSSQQLLSEYYYFGCAQRCFYFYALWSAVDFLMDVVSHSLYHCYARPGSNPCFKWTSFFLRV